MKQQTKVNKAMYIILTVLLGGVGIHKFYAQRWLQGFIYLVFCWTYIPLILSFIDLIIGLFKQSDINGNITF